MGYEHLSHGLTSTPNTHPQFVLLYMYVYSVCVCIYGVYVCVHTLVYSERHTQLQLSHGCPSFSSHTLFAFPVCRLALNFGNILEQL